MIDMLFDSVDIPAIKVKYVHISSLIFKLDIKTVKDT